jgi:signal transduction histidine kinase
MSGIGKITITIGQESEGMVFIDIADDGKGIAKGKIKEVFKPGFTTKKRGWGLGLTLVKRIIENYHMGKIFVKASSADVGTVFRIVLKD